MHVFHDGKSSSCRLFSFVRRLFIQMKTFINIAYKSKKKKASRHQNLSRNTFHTHAQANHLYHRLVLPNGHKKPSREFLEKQPGKMNTVHTGWRRARPGTGAQRCSAAVDSSPWTSGHLRTRIKKKTGMCYFWLFWKIISIWTSGRKIFLAAIWPVTIMHFNSLHWPTIPFLRCQNLPARPWHCQASE